MKQKYYITTPIYYVNDKPHIGHAYTTVAADVVARWHRQRGEEVCFLTGTDEHGAKVAKSAAEAGLKPQDFVNEIAELFRLAWKNLNIKFDRFIRTTDLEHLQSVELFMNKLNKKGVIYEGEYEGLYCVDCEKFITEKELVKGKCPDHNKKPKKIKEKNYFFKLTEFLERIKKLIESDKILIRPAERKTEVLGLFKQKLDDFSVSREKVKWGIPLPFDPKQNIYVWVEALQNYISAIGYRADRKEFDKWWPADCHLMAKDILKFHAVYWPALLLAADETPPRELFVHGFFTIDGKKMSKTLGNVINPNDLVNKYGSDAARFLLLSQFPFGQDGDVKESLFTEKYNANLANGLGNLISRTSNLLEKYQIKLISPTQVIEKSVSDQINQQIKNFQFDEALKGVFELVNQANKYLDDQAPWKLAKQEPEKLPVVLSNVADWIKTIGLLIYPFMPITSRKIGRQFAQELVKKEENLFPRLAD